MHLMSMNQVNHTSSEAVRLFRKIKLTHPEKSKALDAYLRILVKAGGTDSAEARRTLQEMRDEWQSERQNR
jgi:hypothetical protein